MKRIITNTDVEFLTDEMKPADFTGKRPVKARLFEKASTGFMGFGVAITGSSCFLLNQVEKTERQALLRKIYGPDGLDFRMGRISIAASDYSAESYSYCDTPDDVELTHFSIDKDREYIIPMIREILTLQPDLFLLASPWTPPAWMKTNNSLFGGEMKREYLPVYAEYLIRFLKAYRDEGIVIRAITMQNEPETDQGGKMPQCKWAPELEAEFAGILSRRLKEENLPVEIWLHDHNYASLRPMKLLKAYPELQKQVSGVAYHYYTGGPQDTLELQEAYPGLPCHFTEAGPRLDDNYEGAFCKWAIVVSEALSCGFKSQIFWNLILDEEGKPTVGPFNCAGLFTRNHETGEITFSGLYKALRHVAPYVTEKTKIYGVELPKSVCMRNFPPKYTPLYGLFSENESGESALLLVNAWEKEATVEFEYRGAVHQIVLSPNTVETITF